MVSSLALVIVSVHNKTSQSRTVQTASRIVDPPQLSPSDIRAGGEEGPVHSAALTVPSGRGLLSYHGVGGPGCPGSGAIGRHVPLVLVQLVHRQVLNLDGTFKQH